MAHIHDEIDFVVTAPVVYPHTFPNTPRSCRGDEGRLKILPTGSNTPWEGVGIYSVRTPRATSGQSPVSPPTSEQVSLEQDADSSGVNQGRILLIDHRELGLWLFPGGHVELNENTDQALAREIKEETGFGPEDYEVLAERPALSEHISLWRPQWMNAHPINPSHWHISLMYLVRARKLETKLAAGEHKEIKWFTPKDLDDPKLNTPKDLKYYAKEAIRLVG